MLQRTPASFVCGARDSQFDLEMKLGNLYMRQVGGPISIFDMRHSQARPLTFQDNMNAALLINELPHINISSAMTPQDINPATYDIAVVRVCSKTAANIFGP